MSQLSADDLACWDLLQEWFGYCLTGDTSQHKMLPIVGPRRSGKGTIARVLTRLAQSRKEAVEFDWVADMARCGMDVEQALESLVRMARWTPRSVFTPYSLMPRSIQDVAIFAANSVCRIRTWLRMGAPRDDLLIRRWGRREGRIVHSCWVVLMLRAGELVALCERLRIRGCTVTFARQHPFRVALAVKYRLHGGIDYED